MVGGAVHAAGTRDKWHAYQVGTQRWATHVGLYMGYYTDEYPKFSGKE